MSTIAAQITSLAIVYSTVYSGADQRKHQSSASLSFVCGEFTGDRWIPRTNGQYRGKCFHSMTSSWHPCKTRHLGQTYILYIAGLLAMYVDVIKKKSRISSDIISNVSHNRKCALNIVCTSQDMGQNLLEQHLIMRTLLWQVQFGKNKIRCLFHFDM